MYISTPSTVLKCTFSATPSIHNRYHFHHPTAGGAEVSTAAGTASGVDAGGSTNADASTDYSVAFTPRPVSVADAEYATCTTATAGTGEAGGSVGDAVYATAYPTPVPVPTGSNVYATRASGTDPAFSSDGQAVYSDADDTSAPSYMPMTSMEGGQQGQDNYGDPYDPELRGYGVYSVPTAGGDSVVVVDNTTA